jgi:hypothetical protein
MLGPDLMNFPFPGCPCPRLESLSDEWERPGQVRPYVRPVRGTENAAGSSWCSLTCRVPNLILRAQGADVHAVSPETVLTYSLPITLFSVSCRIIQPSSALAANRLASNVKARPKAFSWGHGTASAAAPACPFAW